MTQNKYHTATVFQHTLDVLKNTNPVLVQRLMSLFHDLGKTVTRSVSPTGVHFYNHENLSNVREILNRLKYPNEIIDAVELGVKNHMRLKHGGDDAVKLSDKTLRKFKLELGNQLENTLELIHADNLAHSEVGAMPNQINNVRKRLENLKLDKSISGKPKLPINGNDLRSIGILPGPIYSKIFSEITELWLDNPDITREEAISVAKKLSNV
jgi:poly(A) polymerase